METLTWWKSWLTWWKSWRQDHIRAFSQPTSFIHGVDDECEGRSRLEGRCKSEESSMQGRYWAWTMLLYCIARAHLIAWAGPVVCSLGPSNVKGYESPIFEVHLQRHSYLCNGLFRASGHGRYWRGALSNACSASQKLKSKFYSCSLKKNKRK